MKITSANEKKEAAITYTIAGGYRATISHIVDTGIYLSKNNFKTYENAVKWSQKEMNKQLK